MKMKSKLSVEYRSKMICKDKYSKVIAHSSKESCRSRTQIEVLNKKNASIQKIGSNRYIFSKIFFKL
jgi:hypothetical protein